MRLGVFLFENPQKQPDAKVLIHCEHYWDRLFNSILPRVNSRVLLITCLLEV